MKVACFLQLASTSTGLTLSDGSSITYATAVTAIADLRNTLGGTTSSSVENFLLRTPTSYTSSVNTTNQPDLFAVDSNAVAFTRTPHEVSMVEAICCTLTVLCSLYLDQQYGQWLTWFKLLWQFL